MFKFAITALFVISFFYNSIVSAEKLPQSYKTKAISLLMKKNLAAAEKFTDDIPNADKWTAHEMLAIFKNVYIGQYTEVNRDMILIFLRMELVAMADTIKPTHLILPLHENSLEENEHREVAKAILEMWQDLRFMEKTDELLATSCEKVFKETMITQNPNASYAEVKAVMRNMFNLIGKSIFKLVDDAMKTDTELSQMYQKRKTEAHSQVIAEPKITGPFWVSFDTPYTSSEINFFETLDLPLMRKMIVNKKFVFEATKGLRHTANSSVDDYAMARCIIEWSKNETETNEANKMYMEALSNLAPKIPILDLCDYDSITMKLNLELKSKMETKGSISSLLNTCQVKIKQIQEQMNLLHIVFSTTDYLL